MKDTAAAVARYVIARVIFVGLLVYAMNVYAASASCSDTGVAGVLDTIAAAGQSLGNAFADIRLGD